MKQPGFTDSVFVNCPFDAAYAPLFEAIVFGIIDCGFVPRCALEEVDSGSVRLEKIRRMIAGSRYAIHDISRVEVSAASPLPRLNMPFELGLDLGCRYFGKKDKKCLILDSERYRYQKMLSDVAGQDIRNHHNSPDTALTVVRDWLRNASGRKTLPGPAVIRRRHANFLLALPGLRKVNGLDPDDVQFVEYVTMVEEWLETASS